MKQVNKIDGNTNERHKGNGNGDTRLCMIPSLYEKSMYQNTVEKNTLLLV